MVERSWRALQPEDAASLLAASSAPWWIAGGWALDLFCGTPTRSHADLDVGVLRGDVLTVLKDLAGWDVFEAKDGRLVRLPSDQPPHPDVHSLWCRPTDSDQWTLELMLDEGDRDVYVYRRDRRIRRPMSAVVRRTLEGLPYLAPEIQLLYKSKAPRERDEIDFAQIAPLLAADARSWLCDAIRLINPQHHWLAALKHLSNRGRSCLSATRGAQEQRT